MQQQVGSGKGGSSYKGFKIGDWVVRKGRLGKIKKIHFEMVPPSVTVEMNDTGDEVGTEFDYIRKAEPSEMPSSKEEPKAWSCGTCTYHNDTSLSECQMCALPRSDDAFLVYEDVPTTTATATTTTEQKTDDRASSKKDTINVLQYNVWFNEELAVVDRMNAIGDIIEKNDIDVVTFQELTPLILDLLLNSNWYQSKKDNWQHTVDDQQSSLPYFNGIFTRLPFAAPSFKLFPFKNSRMGRYLVHVPVQLPNGKAVTIATSHLESPVGPKKGGKKDLYSPERHAQLKLSLAQLEDYDNVIFEGDMNWVDPTKTKENDGFITQIVKKPWIDVWHELKPDDKGYTYDHYANPMLTGYYKNRLDRVLFKSKNNDLKCVSINIVGKEPIVQDGKPVTYQKYVKEKDGTKAQKSLPVVPSDHFGLITQFRLL